VTQAYLREYRQSALLPPGSYYRVKPRRATQYGFNSPAAFLNTSGSWTSFADDVKRCFRGSAETTEAGRGDYLANELKRALALQNNQPQAYNRLGTILAHIGLLEHAREMYERARPFHPRKAVRSCFKTGCNV
jgi:hypothetical protein